MLRPHVCTAEAEWSFAPIRDHARLVDRRANDVSGLIVMNGFESLELPGMSVGMIKHRRGDVSRHDVIVRVLLHDVDIVELVFAREKLLDEPGPVIGPVPENLRGDAQHLTARSGIFEETFPRIFS